VRRLSRRAASERFLDHRGRRELIEVNLFRAKEGIAINAANVDCVRPGSSQSAQPTLPSHETRSSPFFSGKRARRHGPKEHPRARAGTALAVDRSEPSVQYLGPARSVLRKRHRVPARSADNPCIGVATLKSTSPLEALPLDLKRRSRENHLTPESTLTPGRKLLQKNLSHLLLIAIHFLILAFIGMGALVFCRLDPELYCSEKQPANRLCTLSRLAIFMVSVSRSAA
jgi:hypothetical protein